MKDGDTSSGRRIAVLVLAALIVFATALPALSERDGPPTLGDPVVVTSPQAPPSPSTPDPTSEPVAPPTSAAQAPQRTLPVEAADRPAATRQVAKRPDPAPAGTDDADDQPGLTQAPPPTTAPDCDDDCGSDDDD